MGGTKEAEWRTGQKHPDLVVDLGRSEEEGLNCMNLPSHGSGDALSARSSMEKEMSRPHSIRVSGSAFMSQ